MLSFCSTLISFIYYNELFICGDVELIYCALSDEKKYNSISMP